MTQREFLPPFPAWLVALYYRWASALNRLWPWIDLDGMRLRVEPSVYKPIQNEHRVAALVPSGRMVLDVGCGSGVLGLAAAAHSERVLCVDVNPAAVRSTRDNARRLGITNLEARAADALKEDLGGPFGVVVCGPPFSEADLPGVERRWASAPGFTGQLFARAAGWLDEDGLLIVHHMARARPGLEALARRHGLRLREVRPNHAKRAKLHALAWLYAQVGLQTTFYVFEREAPGAAEEGRS